MWLKAINHYGPDSRIFPALLGFCVFIFQRQAVMENTTTFSIMLKQMRHIFLGLLIVMWPYFPARFIENGLHSLRSRFDTSGIYTLWRCDLERQHTVVVYCRFSFQPQNCKIFLVLFVAKVLEDREMSSFKEFFLCCSSRSRLYPSYLWQLSTGVLLGLTVLVMMLCLK